MPPTRSGLGDNLSGNAANLSGTTLHGGRANLNNSGGAMFRTQGSRPPPLQRDETSEREEPRCAPALELVAHSCAQCNTRNPALAGRNRRGRLAPSTLWRQRQPAPPPKRAERGVRNVASVVTPTTRFSDGRAARAVCRPVGVRSCRCLHPCWRGRRTGQIFAHRETDAGGPRLPRTGCESVGERWQGGAGRLPARGCPVMPVLARMLARAADGPDF